MEIITAILKVAAVVLAVALCVVILIQDSKGDSWFSSFSGSTSTYWKKGMGSKGKLEKATWILGAGLMVISLVLFYI